MNVVNLSAGRAGRNAVRNNGSNSIESITTATGGSQSVTFKLSSKRRKKSGFSVDQVSHGLALLLSNSANDKSFENANLLLGRFRPSLLCSLLGVPTSAVLAATGLSLDTWRSYECGRRNIPNDLKIVLEDFIKDEFAKFCK